jgi:hypothetical protein
MYDCKCIEIEITSEWTTLQYINNMLKIICILRNRLVQLAFISVSKALKSKYV